jgi:hypothetical protein
VGAQGSSRPELLNECELGNAMVYEVALSVIVRGCLLRYISDAVEREKF